MGDMSAFLDVVEKPKIERTQPARKLIKADIPEEYQDLRPYDVFKTMEKKLLKNDDVDRDISGCVVTRNVQGNLGAMIQEFQKILI